jgi:DNA-directed RNA polymerase specialized sigma24 family protein
VTDTPHDTCWTVLRAAADGDSAARSSFLRTYEATIRGFLAARWRGRMLSTEVDDATQDVLIECLKTDGVLARADADRGDFRGLLFGVARNIARRFEERAQQRGRLRPEDSGWLRHVASDDPGQATLFDRGWARSLVRQAKKLHQARALLDGEAGRRRIELLERRFGDDEAIRHIAAAWGVPAQNVHNAYRKARTEFYRCLMEIVGAHAPDGADLDAECRRLLGLLR